MMSEIPLQIDLFTRQAVDARSSHQRKLDRERGQPQQTLMFSIDEVFAFGARVKPWLTNIPAELLVLEREDVRTPEDVERDLQREAEHLTVPMFAEDTPLVTLTEEAVATANITVEEQARKALDKPYEAIIGYRRRARRQMLCLRTRH